MKSTSIHFKKRIQAPKNATICLGALSWDIYSGTKRIGWFGVYRKNEHEAIQYTDIEIMPVYQGQGFFKKTYKHYLRTYWDKQALHALVAKNNKKSIHAHIAAGYEIIKVNELAYEFKIA